MKTNITSCVYYLIHVKTPNIKEVELFVTNCPDNLTNSNLKTMLYNAGYYFGEHGREWANYSIQIGLDNDIDLKRQFINGKVDYRHHMDDRTDKIEMIDYEDLVIKSLVLQSIN